MKRGANIKTPWNIVVEKTAGIFSFKSGSQQSYQLKVNGRTSEWESIPTEDQDSLRAGMGMPSRFPTWPGWPTAQGDSDAWQYGEYMERVQATIGSEPERCYPATGNIDMPIVWGQAGTSPMVTSEAQRGLGSAWGAGITLQTLIKVDLSGILSSNPNTGVAIGSGWQLVTLAERDRRAQRTANSGEQIRQMLLKRILTWIGLSNPTPPPSATWSIPGAVIHSGVQSEWPDYRRLKTEWDGIVDDWNDLWFAWTPEQDTKPVDPPGQAYYAYPEALELGLRLRSPFSLPSNQPGLGVPTFTYVGGPAAHLDFDYGSVSGQGALLIMRWTSSNLSGPDTFRVTAQGVPLAV